MRFLIITLLLSTSIYANDLDCNLSIRSSYNHYDTFGVPFVYDLDRNTTSRLLDYYQFQNLNNDFEINLKVSEKENEYIIFENYKQVYEVSSNLYPLLRLPHEDVIIFHLVKNKIIKYKDGGGVWDSEDILKQLKDKNFTFEEFDKIVKSNYAKNYKIDVIELENTGRALKFFFGLYKVSINKGASDSDLLSAIDYYRSLTDIELNQIILQDNLLGSKNHDGEVFWEYYDQEVDTLRCYSDEYKEKSKTSLTSDIKISETLCLGKIYDDLPKDPYFSNFDNVNFDDYEQFIVLGSNISYDHDNNESNFLLRKYNAHSNNLIVGLCR